MGRLSQCWKQPLSCVEQFQFAKQEATIHFRSYSGFSLRFHHVISSPLTFKIQILPQRSPTRGANLSAVPSGRHVVSLCMILCVLSIYATNQVVRTQFAGLNYADVCIRSTSRILQKHTCTHTYTQCTILMQVGFVFVSETICWVLTASYPHSTHSAYAKK